MFDENKIYQSVSPDFPGDYQMKGVNYSALDSDTSPKIGSFTQKFWAYFDAAVDTIVEIPENLGKDLKSGYEVGVSGVKRVVDDTTGIVGSGVATLSGGLAVPIFILAGALAVVLYFGGKSGAVRITR